MRRTSVAVIAPAFPPSNLTAAQRPRLMARHLPEFGYEPVVFTVEGACLESDADDGLLRLLPPGLEVVRVRALPVRPLRLVGDLSLRAWPYLRAALEAHHARRPFELIYAPTPPNYATVLAARFARRHGIPFVGDFTDPWVQPFLPSDWRSPKAIASHLLARVLEPYVARRLAGIASIAERYVEHVRRAAPRVPTAYMPMGFEPEDFEAARSRALPSEVAALFRPGELPIVYAGALLPRAHEVFRAAIAGLGTAANQAQAAKLRLVFVGTASGGMIERWAREAGAGERVTEIPERLSYLDVLALLVKAHAVLVPGSLEPHYSPSKIFQALLSGRPVVTALHRDSSAAPIAAAAAGVELLRVDEGTSEAELRNGFAAAFARIAALPFGHVARDAAALPAAYSARAAAGDLARLFDTCLGGRAR